MDIQVSDFPCRSAAEVESPHDALVDQNGKGLPAYLLQHADLRTKVELASGPLHDPSVFVMVRKQGPVE